MRNFIKRNILHRPFCYRLASRILRFLHLSERRGIASELKSCGAKVDVYPEVFIYAPEHVTLGERVSLAPFVHIWGAGGVNIGNRVMIGAHTAITSLTHDYKEAQMQDTLIKRPVVIEDDVWIGSNVTIMPGVTLGRGAVIGAGAVVTKDVAPFAIAVGVPATLLKMREFLRFEGTGSRVHPEVAAA